MRAGGLIRSCSSSMLARSSSLFSTRANFLQFPVDMADEAVYAAGGDSIKRKYEESPQPAGRRSTGFSSQPDSGAPPPLYNSVPPPMNEIELAKQKAQEIAARLLNSSDPSKRARVENGAGAGGYDAVDTGAGQKHHPALGLGGTPQSASYGYGGYPGPNKKIRAFPDLNRERLNRKKIVEKRG